MPDQTGRLSPVEKIAVLNHIKAKHGELLPCPIHPTIAAAWVVNEYVQQNIVFPVQNTMTTLSVVPLGWPWPYVVVACGHCGYTMHFNAALIGLFPQTPPAGA